MAVQTEDRITTPFGAESTAAEVVEGIDLTGKRAIVTGAASGIGIETARALAGAGAEVTMAVVIHRREANTIAGVAPYALDPANAERLWDVSLGLID